MREVIEAFSSRIRSPLYGYFLISVIALNWKALFYLFFANEKVTHRIVYFEEHTSFATLLGYPLLFAALFTILYPWLNYAFLYLCRKPTELRNTVQAQSDHNLIIRKQEMEEVRSRLLKVRENDLIDRVKRNELLNEIKDTEARDKLSEDIEKLRQGSDGSTTSAKDKEEALGVLEYRLKIEEGFEGITAITQRITASLTKDITPKIELAGKAMVLKGNTTKKQIQTMKKLASDIRGFVKLVEESNDEYKIMLRDVRVGLDALLSNVDASNPESKYELEQLINSLTSTVKSAKEGVTGVLGLIHTINNLPLIEAEFDGAKASMSLELQNFANNIKDTIKILQDASYDAAQRAGVL